MARKTKDKKPKPKAPSKAPSRGRGPATEATIDEFQKEGMGIAAKE